MQLSFLGESRRLVNRRLKRELRLTLLHPTVAEGLARADAAGGAARDNARSPQTPPGDDR